MTQPRSPLPTDVAALQAMVVVRDQMIEALKLTIAKLQHARHGASSERGRKLLDCKSRSNNPSVKRPIGLAAPEQNCGS